MRRFVFCTCLVLALGVGCLAQNSSNQSSSSQSSSNKDSSNQSSSDRKTSGQTSSTETSPALGAESRSAERSREADESSSRDTKIDISAPKDDAKNHPESASAVSDLEPEYNGDVSDVQEVHPWNPMKALKDIEVGDFYFKRKNYKAALERYKEALYYKDNDAVASFRLAECQEKLGNRDESRKFYEQYLKILPDGPFAKEAQASLARLGKNQ